MYYRLANMVFYNFILRMLMQSYFVMAISAFIALPHLEFEGKIELINSGTTIGSFFILIGYPIFVFVFLKCH